MSNKNTGSEVGLITLFVPTLSGGGAERAMILLANALFEQGCKVDLLLVNATGPFKSAISPGVRVVDMGASRALFCLPSLVKYLRSEHPPVILSFLNYANVIIITAKRLAGVSTRIIVTEQNCLSMKLKNLRTLSRHILLGLMRLTYPQADGIVAVSSGVADDLAISLRIPRKTVCVVYNPVAEGEMSNWQDDDVVHEWLEPGRPPVVLGAGRLTPQKDFAVLIKAFAEIRKNNDVQLIILGEGELRSELDGLIKKLGLQDVVDLPGFVDNPYEYMRRCALFVLSSQYEGFGNVLVEAMACGAPVVSTNCPNGPSEILGNGKWGRLVPVKDVYALAEAMDATLNEKEHPDVMERAKYFTVDRAVDEYMKLLRADGV